MQILVRIDGRGVPSCRPESEVGADAQVGVKTGQEGLGNIIFRDFLPTSDQIADI